MRSTRSTSRQYGFFGVKPQIPTNNPNTKMIAEVETKKRSDKMIDEREQIVSNKRKNTTKNVDQPPQKEQKKEGKLNKKQQATNKKLQIEELEEKNNEFGKDQKEDIFQAIKFIPSEASEEQDYFEITKHGQGTLFKFKDQRYDNLQCYIETPLNYQSKYILRCEFTNSEDGYFGIGVTDKKSLSETFMSVQDVLPCKFFQVGGASLGEKLDVIKGADLNDLGGKKLSIEIAICLKDNLIEYSDLERKNVCRVSNLKFNKKNQHFITLETGYLMDPKPILFTQFIEKQ